MAKKKKKKAARKAARKSTKSAKKPAKKGAKKAARKAAKKSAKSGAKKGAKKAPSKKFAGFKKARAAKEPTYSTGAPMPAGELYGEANWKADEEFSQGHKAGERERETAEEIHERPASRKPEDEEDTEW